MACRLGHDFCFLIKRLNARSGYPGSDILDVPCIGGQEGSCLYLDSVCVYKEGATGSHPDACAYYGRLLHVTPMASLSVRVSRRGYGEIKLPIMHYAAIRVPESYLTNMQHCCHVSDISWQIKLRCIVWTYQGEISGRHYRNLLLRNTAPSGTWLMTISYVPTEAPMP